MANNTSPSIIFNSFDRVVRFLCVFSPVEWFKKSFIYVFADGSPEKCRNVGIVAIDIFIIFKWAIVIALWRSNFDGLFSATIVGYLLFMNNHSYFCHHLWFHEGAAPSDPQRERRRFLNLGLAAAYSVLCFAYFYAVVVPEQFVWPEGISKTGSAILFSIGNSLTGFSGDLRPVGSTANFLVSLQLISTFVFIAILLSNSIPRTRD